MSDPETLQQLAARRWEDQRPTHVQVLPEDNAAPPFGQGVAETVAEMLVADGGTVLTEDFDDLGHGDVALLTFEYDAWRQDVEGAAEQLRDLAESLRVTHAGAVLYMEPLALPSPVPYYDARVLVDGGEAVRVQWIQVKGYSDDIYVIELDGLGAA